MKQILIHYGEIALKNRNRPLFEKALSRHIERSFRNVAPLKIRRLQGRFLIEFPAPPDEKITRRKLSEIFGIANFIPCDTAPPSLDALKEKLAGHLKSLVPESFAVRARRVDQQFPVSSQYVNETIGAFIQEKTGAKVDLTHPQTTFHMELFSDKILFGFEKIRGAGGMPVGTAGKVALLLSGGIDSPVAGWRMMKRGCRLLPIHFHSAPYTSPASLEKAMDLAERLNAWQGESRFMSVQFGEIQQTIIAGTPEALRIVLYRRMMFRIAERLAREEGCLGLATGESLSQVSSQTLHNLGVINAAATLPVFRPLIGMDKEEIIAEARRIGTFDLSIAPHPDCCSFMAPKNPRTRCRPEELETAEKKFDVDSLVQKGVKECRSVQLSYAQANFLPFP